jgi:ABC-type Na+ efflux pump permease subunit
MWNFLLAVFVGSAAGSTRTAQRSVRPILTLVAIGVIVAGLIYACVIFKAVSERSSKAHVSTHGTH